MVGKLIGMIVSMSGLSAEATVVCCMLFLTNVAPIDTVYLYLSAAVSDTLLVYDALRLGLPVWYIYSDIFCMVGVSDQNDGRDIVREYCAMSE